MKSKADERSFTRDVNVPMTIVTDKLGEQWLCSSNISSQKDLESQGCWRLDDVHFESNIYR